MKHPMKYLIIRASACSQTRKILGQDGGIYTWYLDIHMSYFSFMHTSSTGIVGAGADKAYYVMDYIIFQ